MSKQYQKQKDKWIEKGKLQALKETKCFKCNDTLENTQLICWTCHCKEKEKVWIEAKKEILELINKTKLPEDKDYRYSNKYIDNWIDELKQLQKEVGGIEE